jgi:hypothetical protein
MCLRILNQTQGFDLTKLNTSLSPDSEVGEVHLNMIFVLEIEGTFSLANSVPTLCTHMRMGVKKVFLSSVLDGHKWPASCSFPFNFGIQRPPPGQALNRTLCWFYRQDLDYAFNLYSK